MNKLLKTFVWHLSDVDSKKNKSDPRAKLNTWSHEEILHDNFMKLYWINWWNFSGELYETFYKITWWNFTGWFDETSQNNFMQRCQMFYVDDFTKIISIKSVDSSKIFQWISNVHSDPNLIQSHFLIFFKDKKKYKLL